MFGMYMLHNRPLKIHDTVRVCVHASVYNEASGAYRFVK